MSDTEAKEQAGRSQDKDDIEAAQSGEKHTHHRFEVPSGQEVEIRLDKYLSRKMRNTSRTRIKDAIEEGLITVNGEQEKPSYTIEADDVIDVTIPKPPPPKAKPEKLPINVVYEDDDLMVVHKEAGMVVHPGVGNWTGTLVNGLMHYCDSLAETDDSNIRPGLVHRLDKDTSGLLVVAKTDHALSKLGNYFKYKKAERRYWALIWGHPSYKRGKIFGPIGRSPRDRKKFAVVKPENGKEAVTHYKVLEYFDHLTLVELRLETGRTHQIRVHFSHNEMPVFGDPVYGGDSVRYGPNTGPRKQMFDRLFKQLGGQCLHARTLGFEHPRTGEMMRFESELPKKFQITLDEVRKNCK